MRQHKGGKVLAGAHRTGKTTLARAFAHHSGVPFIETGASAVFAEMGYDPKVDYSMDVRLEIQKRILESFEKQCRPAARGEFITDRTPVDFMAYTLADVQRENIPSGLNQVIETYLNDCISVSNSLFPILILVQPGIPLIDAPGKAPANILYMEHLNHLMMGILMSDEISSHHFYIPRNTLSIPDRIAAIDFCIMRADQKFSKEKDMMARSGRPMIFH